MPRTEQSGTKTRENLENRKRTWEPKVYQKKKHRGRLQIRKLWQKRVLRNTLKYNHHHCKMSPVQSMLTCQNKVVPGNQSRHRNQLILRMLVKHLRPRNCHNKKKNMK